MNQLVVLEQLKPLVIFTPEGTDDILARLRKEAKSHLPDISSPDGREQIRSLAYKIAKSKTYLDDMGKDLVSGWKEQSKLVDAERKRIRDTLDDLKDEVRAPLTEWENREKDRVAVHEACLLRFDDAVRFDLPHPPSADVQKRLDGIDELYAREWQEFAKRAQIAHDAAHKRLNDVLATSQKHEFEQAELERLRREDVERKQRERDEQIKAEAAAKAKDEAEAEAKAAADAEAHRVKAVQDQAEQERQRLQGEKEAAEMETAEADARARKAEEERLAAVTKAEDDRKAAAEQAELARLAAEAKAASDAEAAAEKAEHDREAAVQAERNRVEEARKAEAEATARREADKKHRAKVNNEALAALGIVLTGDGLLTAGAAAKAVVEAIAKGDIPHIKINY